MEKGYATRQYLTPKRGVTITCPETGRVYEYMDTVPEDSVVARTRRDSLQFCGRGDAVSEARASLFDKKAEPESDSSDD